MSFKYLSNTTYSSPSSIMRDDFQSVVLEEGKIATDVYDVLEETTFASNEYINYNVRITSCVDPDSGAKLGDDWKRLLFYSDISHPVSVGMKYLFSDNYWIGINAENLNSLTASISVRRCNNVLRWMSGSTIVTEPACIDYDFKNPRLDVPKNDAVTPQAYIRIFVQQNSNTNTIRQNQRFLFGNKDNWICFRVLALRNFHNTETLDNDSSRLMVLEVQEYQYNSTTDDLVNGIADRYIYTTSGSSSAIDSVVVEPSNGYVLEGLTQTFDARYYSGSSIVSGSFTFSVSGSDVPLANYYFNVLSGNEFSVTNNLMYLDNSLNILCSGSSGSRIFPVVLRGAW
jgi:hypothetical protein